MGDTLIVVRQGGQSALIKLAADGHANKTANETIRCVRGSGYLVGHRRRQRDRYSA
jgi:hypothetical protein